MTPSVTSLLQPRQLDESSQCRPQLWMTWFWQVIHISISNNAHCWKCYRLPLITHSWLEKESQQTNGISLSESSNSPSNTTVDIFLKKLRKVGKMLSGFVDNIGRCLEVATSHAVIYHRPRRHAINCPILIHTATLSYHFWCQYEISSCVMMTNGNGGSGQKQSKGGLLDLRGGSHLVLSLYSSHQYSELLHGDSYHKDWNSYYYY